MLKNTELVAAAARTTKTPSKGNMLQMIPPCQGHEKAQNATDVVVLTISPGITEARVTWEVPMIRKHLGSCVVIAVMC